MSYHSGPTYQYISPKGIAGLLVVLFVVIAFLSLFGIKDIEIILITAVASAVTFMIARVTIIKIIRAKAEKDSLVTKTDELFDPHQGDSSSP